MHAARLLHRPCSCGLAFALRRAACDESLEYSNDLGLYIPAWASASRQRPCAVRRAIVRERGPDGALVERWDRVIVEP